ncbi:hypothetical protein ACP4OV_025703 [Aristida adscensionis]
MASFVSQVRDMFFVLVERVTGYGREEEEAQLHLHVVQRGQAGASHVPKVNLASDEAVDGSGGSRDGVHANSR